MTGRCIGLSCLKKWDNDDKVGRFGRCRPSCLEPQCTNLGALRLFACPCVVLMSRSLLRGTASTAVPTKTANLFAGWHTWARPPFGEKPGGRKLDFTDLMDEFLGWHGRWRRWLGARGWRSCRERVVEFSATSPRWLSIGLQLCTQMSFSGMLSGDAMNVYCSNGVFFGNKILRYVQYWFSIVCSTWQTLSLFVEAMQFCVFGLPTV